MFARTYAPNKVPEAVKAWRGDLQSKKREKLAATIADPIENPELFEEWQSPKPAAPAEDLLSFV